MLDILACLCESDGMNTATNSIDTITTDERIADLQEQIDDARERMADAAARILTAASPAEVAKFTARRDYNYAEIGRFTRCIERIGGTTCA